MLVYTREDILKIIVAAVNYNNNKNSQNYILKG